MRFPLLVDNNTYPAIILKQLNRVFRCYRVTICLLLFSGNYISLHAQADSTYITRFPEEFSLGTYLYYQYTALGFDREGQMPITYRPNSPIGIGLSVGYKNYALSGGMGFKFLRDAKRGDTKVLDLQYHYFGRTFTADLFLQRYKGYYTERAEQIILYPDIKVEQYGLHWEYVFNHKKFSYRAAFNQSERQLKSAGSFHLGGGLYYNQVKSDSTLNINRRVRLHNYQFSVTGGYGYAWVITPSFYMATSLSLGINFGTDKLTKIKGVEIAPSILPRLAAGYNGNGWSVGIWYVLNSMYIRRYNSLDISFDTGYTQVTFIKRFQYAPRFLKKIKFLN